MVKILRLLAAAALFCLAAVSRSPWLAPGLASFFSVSVYPGRHMGGEGLLLEIRGVAGAEYRLFDGGRVYRPYRQPDGAWTLMLPLGIESAGTRVIRVEAEMPGGGRVGCAVSRPVDERPARVVRIGAGSLAMRRRRPAVPEQLENVRAALHHRSEDQLWSRPFAPPLEGRVSTAFGVKRVRAGYAAFHYGVDFAAPEGTPVRALNAGRVLLAASGYSVFGNALIIDHGQGLVSCYYHLARILTTEGQSVAAGEPVALVGNTGWSTGPHLHLGVYLQGEPIDPLWLVSFSRERFAGRPATDEPGSCAGAGA